ncbi:MULTISPECIES: hypothetical protein [Microcystis]|nr:MULTISPECIES: hypothetical protein [Microcystis]MCZ8356858.1 hypothetical protein [Microcystis sp. LE19-388.1G]
MNWGVGSGEVGIMNWEVGKWGVGSGVWGVGCGEGNLFHLWW